MKLKENILLDAREYYELARGAENRSENKTKVNQSTDACDRVLLMARGGYCSRLFVYQAIHFRRPLDVVRDKLNFRGVARHRHKVHVLQAIQHGRRERGVVVLAARLRHLHLLDAVHFARDGAALALVGVGARLPTPPECGPIRLANLAEQIPVEQQIDLVKAARAHKLSVVGESCRRAHVRARSENRERKKMRISGRNVDGFLCR